MFEQRRSLNPLVPQRHYANNRSNRTVRKFKPEPSIYFDTYSSQGFLIKDALNRNFKPLVGREDPMLPYSTAISLRFEVCVISKAFGGGHVLTAYPISSRAMNPSVDK